MPTAPKPPPVQLAWHPPTWPQVVAWAVGLAGLVLGALPTLPPIVDTRYPWLRPALTVGAGVVLWLTRTPGAPSQQQLGVAVAALVEQRTSLPPTTPAAEARAQLAGPPPMPTTRPRTVRDQDQVRTLDGEDGSE